MPTLKVAQDLIDLIYPIGYLFITTDKTFNPNNTLGGTWARLEGDVYLKNVPSSATSQPIGNYGGTSSTHQIPISSIPSHAHYGLYWAGRGFSVNDGNSCIKLTSQSWSAGDANANYWNTGNTGGGQAYYPYYYGVICWHRIG